MTLRASSSASCSKSSSVKKNNDVLTYCICDTSASWVTGRDECKRSATGQDCTDSVSLPVGVVCSRVSFMSSRRTTHQEHSEMCEVITETAGTIRRNTAGNTTSAVPTTLPAWQTHTHTHI